MKILVISGSPRKGNDRATTAQKIAVYMGERFKEAT
jgi:putative cell wall-binding protein